MTNLNWYTVSPLGNGVGLTVLRLESPETNSGKASGTTLIFHILPKLWAETKTFWQLPSQEELLAKPLHEFTLYEQDYLGLEDSKLTELFEELAIGKISAEEIKQADQEDENTEEKSDRLSPLWRKYASAPEEPKSLPDKQKDDSDSQLIRSFWKMLDSFRAEIEPVPNSKDFGSSGLDLFAENATLKSFIYRRFIEDTYQAIHDRRPLYVPIQEEIGAIRGSLLVEGLIQRKITKSPKVLCEFDDLTTNNHIWQVIRAALDTVVPEIADFKTIYERALLCDSQLQDVAVQSVAELVAQARYFSLPRSESDFVQKSYRLAKAILEHRFNATTEDSVGSGVIANLKYSMDGVWEQMVHHYFESQESKPKVSSHIDVPAVNIFYERSGGVWENALDGGKKPDVLVETSEGSFYVDAKYKPKELGITKATMSDQYQMASYALRTRRNVYLAYPTCEKSKVGKEPAVQFVPYEDNFRDNQEKPDTVKFVRTGQFYLPFPTKDQVERGSYFGEAEQKHRAEELARTQEPDASE